MPRKPTTTYEPGDEPNRCCAKSKTTGSRCSKPVVPGRRVCRYHGGLGGRPPESGRYSKGLGKLREAYDESRNDPALLDLRETLALLDIVVKKAAERAANADSPEFRSEALELYETARGAATPEEGAAALNALGALLRRGAEEDKALKALAETAERLSRRQEKAWQIRLDAAMAINARDLVAVLSRFADIVLEEAPKDVAGRIVRRLDGEIMGAGATAVRLEVGDPA